MDNTDVEKIEGKIKIKLSVRFIASYLTTHSQAQIARIAGVTDQAVSSYIQKHWDMLGPLVKNDSNLAMMSKEIAINAQNKISFALDKMSKKDARKQLLALNAISGTHIDKYRLLSDQSTQNIDILSIQGNLTDIQRQREAISKRIEALKGVINIDKTT